MLQGELEHRTSKARYGRTDHKAYIEQLTHIERRQARLRTLRERLGLHLESVPRSLEEHHHIGSSQNVYEHLGTFLHRHAGDPAIKVSCSFSMSTTVALIKCQDFYPKLKHHLLERIRSAPHSIGRESEAPSGAQDSPSGPVQSLILQHDRLYIHALLRINYTTYDVRRAQDVISPSTSHHNVMVLADDSKGKSCQFIHPYAYAKVLRVFHVNLLEVGAHGAVNYYPRRMEVLWVRWYQLWNPDIDGWHSQQLDELSFPPIDDTDAFGFLDPSDVLRACHLVPVFAKGRKYEDGTGISQCAKDQDDWARYYIKR